MNNKINLIEINQPIGTFYVGKISTKDLLSIYKVVRRDTEKGIQRELNDKRVKEISQYCTDPDATFPTPIILAVSSDNFKIEKKENDFFTVEYEENKGIAEILDGQHRVEGINSAKGFESELMIVVMFDLTEEEKAYVFSTINSKQTKVPSSIIYDLFELSEGRSPEKTCHEIARILNSNEDSPFYKRLKMLGKKTKETESLSQGTFVKELLKLITKKSQEDSINSKNNIPLDYDDSLPLRKYFIDNEDSIILKIVTNYFGAISDVFKDEWDDTNTYILLKTTGYIGFLKAFTKIYENARKSNDFTRGFLGEQFNKTKQYLLGKNLKLTSVEFPSNAQQQTRLSKIILESMELE